MPGRASWLAQTCRPGMRHLRSGGTCPSVMFFERICEGPWCRHRVQLVKSCGCNCSKCHKEVWEGWWCFQTQTDVLGMQSIPPGRPCAALFLPCNLENLSELLTIPLSWITLASGTLTPTARTPYIKVLLMQASYTAGCQTRFQLRKCMISSCESPGNCIRIMG